MNDAMSKELQQPQVEPLLDTNRHRSAVKKTLESHSKGLVPERITRTLRMLRQNAAATVLAGLFAVGNANCNNVEQQNTPQPIPPPAVSEYQRLTPSAELVPTTEVPSPPPTIKQQTPSPTPKPPETFTPSVPEQRPPIPPRETPNEAVDKLRQETLEIYSQIMDAIESSVPKEKRYFVKIGEKGKYQDRALIFTEPIEQDGQKIWIAMTRDGPKSFSAKDNSDSSNYFEKFIGNSIASLRQGDNDFLPYERALLADKPGKLGPEIASLIIREPNGSINFISFRNDPPPLHMIEEAVVKSQEAAGLHPQLPRQLAKEGLERAKSLYEVLTPHINPNPSPSQPPASQSR